MKARHVARELALLALFQRERHGALPAPATDSADCAEGETIQDLIQDAVRALSDQAQGQIREAVEALAIAADEIARLEQEHPDNLQTSLETPAEPVALPTTRVVYDHLTSVLQAARMLGEALRIPELSAHAASESVRSYASQLIDVACAHRDEIDAALEAASEEWKVSRMARMDRNILRLALAEMRYIDGVDAGVSIDEAVQFAREFSTPDSYRFINGVLGQLAQDPAAAQQTPEPEAPLGGDVGGDV
ncbi:MAG: transcription antitermination factor NusB [Vampirovibrionales bacterium]|nr:transcription antitermination factor NusB [Vampirovibrionales bacterium]